MIDRRQESIIVEIEFTGKLIFELSLSAQCRVNALRKLSLDLIVAQLGQRREGSRAMAVKMQKRAQGGFLERKVPLIVMVSPVNASVKDASVFGSGNQSSLLAS